jgi:hypothetical protein
MYPMVLCDWHLDCRTTQKKKKKIKQQQIKELLSPFKVAWAAIDRDTHIFGFQRSGKGNERYKCMTLFAI